MCYRPPAHIVLLPLPQTTRPAHSLSVHHHTSAFMRKQIRILADGGIYSPVRALKDAIVDQLAQTIILSQQQPQNNPLIQPTPATCPALTISDTVITPSTLPLAPALPMTELPLCRPPGPFDWFYIVLERTDWNEVKANATLLLAVLCIAFTTGIILLWMVRSCRARNQPDSYEQKLITHKNYMEGRVRDTRR
jgi:hypothetical protein